MQRKAIKLPDTAGLTEERAQDETGSFVKSEMDKLKVHKALSQLRPFSGRSNEEIMEFVCYMFERLGESNEQICGQKDRNRSFFFVASGQLLHRQLSGDQHRRVVEQRLLELDCWGLECISTGREERICVTATSACRLFVLTSRRFFWLCRMAAERSHRLQLAVADSMLQARLPSVEQVLGFAEPEADTSSGGAVMVPSLDQHTPGIHIPDQSIPKPAVQSKTPKQPPKSLLNAKDGLSRRVNYHLLDGLLHSIKQLDISSHRDPNGDSSVLISCSTGQTMIVYCLTGCVRLILDHCNNVTSVVADNNVALTAGRAHEIGANQNWKMTNSLGEHEKQYQQTIVYLIRLRSNERSSESSTTE